MIQYKFLIYWFSLSTFVPETNIRCSARLKLTDSMLDDPNSFRRTNWARHRTFHELNLLSLVRLMKSSMSGLGLNGCLIFLNQKIGGGLSWITIYFTLLLIKSETRNSLRKFRVTWKASLQPTDTYGLLSCKVDQDVFVKLPVAWKQTVAERDTNFVSRAVLIASCTK